MRRILRVAFVLRAASGPCRHSRASAPTGGDNDRPGIWAPTPWELEAGL
jgi:hypothetical protein